MPPMPLGSVKAARPLGAPDSSSDEEEQHQPVSMRQIHTPEGPSDSEDSAVAGLAVLGAAAPELGSDSESENRQLEEQTDEAAKRMLDALASPHVDGDDAEEEPDLFEDDAEDDDDPGKILAAADEEGKVGGKEEEAPKPAPMSSIFAAGAAIGASIRSLATGDIPSADKGIPTADEIPARAEFPEPEDLSPPDPEGGGGLTASEKKIAAAAAVGAAAAGAGTAAAVATAAEKSRSPPPVPRAGSVRADAPVEAPIEMGEIADVRPRADFPSPRGLTEDGAQDYDGDGASRFDDPEDLGTYVSRDASAGETLGSVTMVANPVRGAPDTVKSIPAAPRLEGEQRQEVQKRYRKCAMYILYLLILVGVIVGITVGIRNSRNAGEEETTPAPAPTPVPPDITEAPTPADAAAPTAAPTVADPFVQLQEYLISISPDGGEALQDPSTPQYAALTWLSESPLLPTYSDTQVNQRYSLATLYYSTGGESWTSSNGWLGPMNECLWLGVSCEAQRPARQLRSRRAQDTTTLVVTKVQLFELGLAGNLPPELVLLPDTNDLTLYGNAITGKIPPFLGELTKLEVLELDGNQMSGAIPLEIYSLTGLTKLRLENNNFVGRIGTEVGQLVALEKFRVDGNFISGTIPAEVGSMVSLTEIRLNTNRITGTVPDTIGSLVAAEGIYLHETSLEGSVPASVCSLIDRNLQDLTSDCGGAEPAIACECCTECYPLEV